MESKSGQHSVCRPALPSPLLASNKASGSPGSQPRKVIVHPAPWQAPEVQGPRTGFLPKTISPSVRPSIRQTPLCSVSLPVPRWQHLAPRSPPTSQYRSSVLGSFCPTIRQKMQLSWAEAAWAAPTATADSPDLASSGRLVCPATSSPPCDPPASIATTPGLVSPGLGRH